jgi:hypothetical protein
MKGYIYISANGTDPALRNNLNDPIFTRIPTLGACMPNLRRFVTRGDFIFVVSGKTAGVRQYVVGGFRVNEKIHALAAYERFPENRLQTLPDGHVMGNIIVRADGTQHPLDRHDPGTFESRLENYLVGSMPVALSTEREVQLGREQTLGNLSSILRRAPGNRVIDVMGRCSKLDEGQVRQMLDWLLGIRATAHG